MNVQPHKPKISANSLAALCIVAVIVLCGGGGGIAGAILSDPEPQTTAAGSTPEQFEDIPTTSPTVEAFVPTEEPSPTVAQTKTTAKPRPSATHRAAPKPTASKPRPRPTNTSSGQKGVHPGSFCSPEGARGTTKTGTSMRCTRKSGEDQARWRKA